MASNGSQHDGSCSSTNDCLVPRHVCNRDGRCGCRASLGLAGDNCEQLTAASAGVFIGRGLPLILTVAAILYLALGVHHRQTYRASRGPLLTLASVFGALVLVATKLAWGLDVLGADDDPFWYNARQTLCEGPAGALTVLASCQLALLWIRAVGDLGISADDLATSPSREPSRNTSPSADKAEASVGSEESSWLAPARLRFSRHALLISMSVYSLVVLIFIVLDMSLPDNGNFYLLTIVCHFSGAIALVIAFRVGASRLRTTYLQLHEALHSTRSPQPQSPERGAVAAGDEEAGEEAAPAPPAPATAAAPEEVVVEVLPSETRRSSRLSVFSSGRQTGGQSMRQSRRQSRISRLFTAPPLPQTERATFISQLLPLIIATANRVTLGFVVFLAFSVPWAVLDALVVTAGAWVCSVFLHIGIILVLVGVGRYVNEKHALKWRSRQSQIQIELSCSMEASRARSRYSDAPSMGEGSPRRTGTSDGQLASPSAH